jgi:hypothetical protein
MMGKWAVLGMIAITILSASCSSPAKPSQEEVKQARAANPYTRGIDKSREVAGEANARRENEAL